MISELRSMLSLEICRYFLEYLRLIAVPKAAGAVIYKTNLLLKRFLNIRKKSPEADTSTQILFWSRYFYTATFSEQILFQKRYFLYGDTILSIIIVLLLVYYLLYLHAFQNRYFLEKDNLSEKRYSALHTLSGEPISQSG